MNVYKPENSSYETRNFSSNISSNMQKKCWMKCWTGLHRPFVMRLFEKLILFEKLMFCTMCLQLVIFYDFYLGFEADLLCNLPLLHQATESKLHSHMPLCKW